MFFVFFFINPIYSSIGMQDRMECSCAMAASSLRNSVKRTVAKTSVCSTEMVLGFAGGEFFRILPPSWWVEPLLLSKTQRRKIELHPYECCCGFQYL